MSEKKARQKRAAQAAQSPEPPTGQPGGATTTVADLLQLLGAKDVEIMGLQRQVAGLQQQVQMLVDQYVRKEEKAG